MWCRVTGRAFVSEDVSWGDGDGDRDGDSGYQVGDSLE